jgi:hypothetical protein
VDDVEEDYLEGSPLLLETLGTKRGREEGHGHDERVNNSLALTILPLTDPISTATRIPFHAQPILSRTST